jgi:hypothetical protein
MHKSRQTVVTPKNAPAPAHRRERPVSRKTPSSTASGPDATLSSLKARKNSITTDAASSLTIDALDEDHCELQRRFGKFKELEAGQLDLTLGHIAVKDFANTRALDGLIMYERRIESSLYKTLFEFGRRQSIRKKQSPNSVDEETEHLLMSDK